MALHHVGDPLDQKAEFNGVVPTAAVRARLVGAGLGQYLGADPPV